MIWDLYVMAFDALKSNKARTVLSMLGVIIGVSTVIVVFGIGEAARNSIADQYKNLNVTSLFVMGSMGGRGPGTASSKLSEDDVAAILQGSNKVAQATALQQGSGSVSYGSTETSYSIYGSSASLPSISNLTLQSGRFYTDEESASRSKVVVLGYTSAQALFGDNVESGIGQIISVSNKKS